MSDDLQTLLRPLREVEPTRDELARLEAAIRDARPASRGRRRGLVFGGFGRRRLAALAFASLAVAVAVAALPSGSDNSLRGALRTAAAAAAETPAGAPFTGYRHIVERVRNAYPGSPPREFEREAWVDAKWRGVGAHRPRRRDTGRDEPARASRRTVRPDAPRQAADGSRRPAARAERRL